MVSVSCIGVDTQQQLTPRGSLFGLDLLVYSLKFSMATEWQREGNGEKLSDIQTARNTHTHVHQHPYINVHTCTHNHSYTHMHINTLNTSTHVQTDVHIYTDVTQRTKIQVPYGESSSRGCTGKTLGQYTGTSLSPVHPSEGQQDPGKASGLGGKRVGCLQTH